MIETLLNLILELNLFFIPVILIMLYFCTFLWASISTTLRIKPYDAEQRIHEFEIPRFGGLIIFFTIYLFVIYEHFNEYSHDHIICLLSLCSMPIFFVGLYEDFIQNSHPYLRLFSMFLAAAAALIFSGIELPSLAFPFLGPIISDSFFIYPFLIISIAIFINGMNMVDGSNGLMSMTAICQLASIIFISIQSSYFSSIDITVMLLVSLICFLPFNFPFGKIFIGDLGAYLYGFFIGFIVIRFYGDNPTLPSWGAVLVLFYPLMEVFFSYFRRVFNNRSSPFKPDTSHLHIKVFFVLNQITGKKVANSLVMPTIFIIWLSPSILYIHTYDSLPKIMSALMILVIIYLSFYWAISNKKKKKLSLNLFL